MPSGSKKLKYSNFALLITFALRASFMVIRARPVIPGHLPFGRHLRSARLHQGFGQSALNYHNVAASLLPYYRSCSTVLPLILTSNSILTCRSGAKAFDLDLDLDTSTSTLTCRSGAKAFDLDLDLNLNLVLWRFSFSVGKAT